jgi:uncharacterized protein YjdB
MSKKLFYFLLIEFFGIILFSCSKDDLVPEISFPAGTIDYFNNSIDFDQKASNKTIEFISNVPWSISIDKTRDGSEWCYVSPSHGEAGSNKITISVLDNNNFEERNAVLRLSYNDSVKTIIVNQKQLDALTSTTNRFEVPVEGGVIEIEVSANVKYEALIPTEYQSWIHRENSNTKTRALSKSIIKYRIDPSEEYDKREGSIIIQSGDLVETINVYQAGEGIMTLTNKEFNLDSSEQDIKIEIKSNFEYSVEMPNVDWIKENDSKTRAVSTHSISLHINENTSYDNREATIRFYDKNSTISENVIIRQSQQNAIIIETKEYTFDEKGGEFTVILNSNVNYEVKNDESWISEISGTHSRALIKNSHTFKVNPISANTDRKGKIIFSNTSSGINEEITVIQNRSIFFDFESINLMAGESESLSVTNRTIVQDIKWESSNTSIVTVDDNGIVNALKKGDAIITATTIDGKHKCSCIIHVKDITDYISAYCIGGSIVSINGLIKYGSVLNWMFNNQSTSSVNLISLQLVDGMTSTAGNEMSVNQEVNAGSSVGYSTTIGLAGIHTPVTCNFKYSYKGQTYTTSAVYK